MLAMDLISNSKFVFENGLFTDKLEKHEQCIDQHYFNQCVDILLPEVEDIPADILTELSGQLHHLVNDLPVSRLVEHEFLEAFVKRGAMFMLSQDTSIDTDDCVALLPTGDLILNVTSKTYIELGLQGQVSRYHKRYRDKYVIKIPLLSSNFQKGSKHYSNVKWCLDKWKKTFSFLVAWQPNDPSICSSSLSTYMSTAWDVTCQECALRASRHMYRHLTSPLVCSTLTDESDDHCDPMDFYEWMGAVSSQINCDSDVALYTDAESCPRPQMNIKRCLATTFTGFFTTDSISVILNILRNLVKKNTDIIPWVALSVHGFEDSPVSWGLREHGNYDSGDNSYSIVLFPDDHIWLYKELGYHDVSD